MTDERYKWITLHGPSHFHKGGGVSCGFMLRHRVRLPMTKMGKAIRKYIRLYKQQETEQS